MNINRSIFKDLEEKIQNMESGKSEPNKNITFSSNTTSHININGKVYKSLEDLPDDLKSLFVDANNNGVPDKFDQLTNQTPITTEGFVSPTPETEVLTKYFFSKIQNIKKVIIKFVILAGVIAYLVYVFAVLKMR